ncbi:uncharacterized protein LOC127059453 [Serinus canaria]|uniref:uncharacterized protein LOC127059453 n=1 Tax=Serinus canaria TaxID=9135 RepID=UPI0021CCE704|nr:uncharacterized protein LOC127059453 [Serinus canaria]
MRWAAATPPPAQGGAPPAPRPRSAAAWTHRPLPALPSAPRRARADNASAPPRCPRGRSHRLCLAAPPPRAAPEQRPGVAPPPAPRFAARLAGRPPSPAAPPTAAGRVSSPGPRPPPPRRRRPISAAPPRAAPPLARAGSGARTGAPGGGGGGTPVPVSVPVPILIPIPIPIPPPSSAGGAIPPPVLPSAEPGVRSLAFKSTAIPPRSPAGPRRPGSGEFAVPLPPLPAGRAAQSPERACGDSCPDTIASYARAAGRETESPRTGFLSRREKSRPLRNNQKSETNKKPQKKALERRPGDNPGMLQIRKRGGLYVRRYPKSQSLMERLKEGRWVGGETRTCLEPIKGHIGLGGGVRVMIKGV